MEWIFLVIGLIVGAVASFFITRNKIQKHIKNNPPISAKQIRAMYISMGRKPSESQVQKTLKSMNIKDSSAGVIQKPKSNKTVKKGPIGNKKKRKK